MLIRLKSLNEAVGIDAVIMTKYDSAAKGGIAVSISGKTRNSFCIYRNRGEIQRYPGIQQGKVS